MAETGLGADGMNGIVQVGESPGLLKKIQLVTESIQEGMAETETLLCNASQFAIQQ